MTCEICGAKATETHHIFNGALRQKSEKYGATIQICRECHEHIHKNYKFRHKLKAEYQKQIMKKYKMTIEDFRAEFYKNYLEDNL